VAAAGLALWPSAARAASFFADDFNSGLQNPLLTGYENFSLTGGVIRRNGIYADVNDRQYMRTVGADYNEVDFRFELTFTTSVIPLTSINFIGIGTGNRRPGPSQFGHNEPWESLFFRIHAPNADGGSVGIADGPVNTIVTLGSITTPGTHRARIQKIGDTITFSLDAHYDGMFVADMSHTFPSLTLVAPYLNDTQSRLFFGTVFPDDIFDDLNIVPEPGGLAQLAAAAILLAIARPLATKISRRGRRQGRRA
jgi:hypothetical protein